MSLKKRIALVTAIVGTATLGIHIANRIITFTSTLDNNLNTTKGTYYDWRFGKVFYKKEGTGTPILLIHDLESYSSSYEWNKIVKQLAKTNTVYSIDLLGCGRSDKPNITYTNFLYVQLISDFIKEIIGDKTDIIASSTSSSIVIMATTFDNININRIAITNPVDLGVLSAVPTKRNKVLRWLIKTPIIGTFLYNTQNTKRAIERKFLENFYAYPEHITSTEVKAYHEAAHLGGISSKYFFASVKSNYLNTNINHALKSINNSIYIIASDNSPNYLTIANQYKKILPSIEIFLSNNTEKYPHLEDADGFVKQINLIFD